MDDETKRTDGMVKEDKLTKLLVEAALCRDPQQREALWQEAYKIVDARIRAQMEKESSAHKNGGSLPPDD